MTLSCKRYLKQDYIVVMSYRIQQKIVRVFHQTMVYISHLSDPKNETFRDCCTHSHSIECDRWEELFDPLD